ncbi:MAG: rRNA processing protein RimM [Solirubrobacteraceae bacterium]|nr:rRNA processing protein RimM [Solirubrobacteraceae bacterium]
MTRAQAEWLPAGRVGRPHGLDGSFHVTRPRPALLTSATTVRVGGEDLEIERRAGTDERPILRLTGHAGRAAAEALRGEDLLVRRADAPPLEDDEWYAEDLEGCRVVDGDAAVGTVARLMPLPSCEALEVVRPGAPDLLVPLVGDAVRSVDVAGGVIDIDLAFLGEEPSGGPRAEDGPPARPDPPGGADPPARPDPPTRTT